MILYLYPISLNRTGPYMYVGFKDSKQRCGDFRSSIHKKKAPTIIVSEKQSDKIQQHCEFWVDRTDQKPVYRDLVCFFYSFHLISA